MTHIFTVDVEDWYHGFPPDYRVPPPHFPRLERGMQFLLDTLEEAGIRATFFWLGTQAALYPDLLRECVHRGHEIGSHGFRHTPIFRMTPAEFSEDTRRSLDLISEITGDPVKCFRAPYFSVTRNTFWALEILASLGITHDSSILPLHHWRTGMPDFADRPQVISTSNGPIIELPITSRTVFGVRMPVSGGGFFRAYPYRLSSQNFRLSSLTGKSAVFYIHPWEFDPDQPKLNQHGMIDRLHYLGLRTSEGKLQRLLRDHSFGPLIEIANRTLLPSLSAIQPLPNP